MAALYTLSRISRTSVIQNKGVHHFVNKAYGQFYHRHSAKLRTLNIIKPFPSNVSYSQDKTTKDCASYRLEQTINELQQFVSLDTKSRLTEVVEQLIFNSVQKSDIKSLFRHVPHVHQLYDPQKWQNALLVLSNVGFSSKQICTIMIACHETIFNSQLHDIEATFVTLQALSFRTSQIFDLILLNPSLLTMKPANLENRYNDFLEVFSKKEIFKLMPGNPHLLTTNFSESFAMVEYVVNEMGLQKEHILNTGLFNHSLSHIQMRHTLLLRAGLYERPNKSGATSKITNPSLKMIVDTDDRQFCNKIAFISSSEYMAFKELHQLESSSKFGVTDEFELETQ